MTYAPDNSSYLLTTGDSSLPNSRILNTTSGLQLNLGSSTATLVPTLELGALVNLGNNLGIIARTAAGQLAARSIVSDDSLNITNPKGISGDPTISVVNETTFQKINVLENSVPKSQRATVNYLAGEGIGITVNDRGEGPDGFSGQTDVIISSSYVPFSAPLDAYYILQQPNDLLINGLVIQAGANISVTPGDGIITIASTGDTNSISFDQEIDMDEAYATSIPAGGWGAYPLTVPTSEQLLDLIQNGGPGLIQATANINLSMSYDGNTPFTIQYDITTDANPPVGESLAGKAVYNTQMVTTTALWFVKKPLNDIADPAASRLVLWIANPSTESAMSLVSLVNHVSLSYFPAGYA